MSEGPTDWVKNLLDSTGEAHEASMRLAQTYDLLVNEAVEHTLRAILILRKGDDPTHHTRVAVACTTTANVLRATQVISTEDRT